MAKKEQVKNNPIKMNSRAYRQHSMIRPNEDIVELKGLKDTKMNYEIKELEIFY